MAVLSNVASADGYTAANTLERPNVVRLNLQVLNAAIVYQLGQGWPGVSYHGADEVFLPPGFASLERSATGVRFRSAVAGVPARVTLQLLTVDDVGFEPGP